MFVYPILRFRLYFSEISSRKQQSIRKNIHLKLDHKRMKEKGRAKEQKEIVSKLVRFFYSSLYLNGGGGGGISSFSILTLSLPCAQLCLVINVWVFGFVCVYELFLISFDLGAVCVSVYFVYVCCERCEQWQW